MTTPSPGPADLLRERLTLVAALSALNAEALKLIQRLGAVEMDVLRLELESDRDGASPELVRLLHEAEVEAESIRAGQARCDEEIATVEAQVDEIDRRLASGGNGREERT
jgi:hypothetical protein